MGASPVEDERDLEEYLRRALAQAGYGEEELRRALSSDLSTKRFLKGKLEHASVLGILLYRARPWAGLAPPFLPGALTPGLPLGRRAARPFNGRWSSREAGIRAFLLPDNPWFEQEAADVRRFLGLPCGGVEGMGTEEIPENYWYWRELGHIGPVFLGDLWEVTHTSKAKGQAYSGPELPPFLPAFLRDYLNSPQLLAVPQQSLPGWLQAEPAFPWGRPSRYDGSLPFHRFIANLLYRYGLPPRLFNPVRRYLFTADPADLTPQRAGTRQDSGLSAWLEPVRLPEGAAESTLTLTIQGIDAFTSLHEIREIWRAQVEPAQRSWHLLARQVDFRERHGRFPDLAEYHQLKRRLSRRAKPPFTTAKSYLPVLKLINQGKSLGKALEELSRRGLCPDRRHAERGVKRLQALMKPWQVE